MTNESTEDEMPSEIDFANAVRGKHAGAFKKGHRVRITHADGSVEERFFPPEGEGVVTIAPDLRERFPDSASVNRALRTLVESE